MTPEVKVDELPVEWYTTDPSIYSLEIRTEKRTKWLYINYSNGFKLPEWDVQEAVDYYLSEEGYNDRMESFYRAWGFYD